MPGRHVVITDVNPYRLDLAGRVGITLAVNPQESFGGRRTFNRARSLRLIIGRSLNVFDPHEVLRRAAAYFVPTKDQE